eukprot:6196678-Pleurochrysis_carterae.AAC.1
MLLEVEQAASPTTPSAESRRFVAVEDDDRPSTHVSARPLFFSFPRANMCVVKQDGLVAKIAFLLYEVSCRQRIIICETAQHTKQCAKS